MKTEIKRKTLKSEKVADLLQTYVIFVAGTYLIVIWFFESGDSETVRFWLRLILFEEMFLVFALIREALYIKKINSALAQGDVRYGKIIPIMSKSELRFRRGRSYIVYKIVCECEGRMYEGNVVTYHSVESGEKEREIYVKQTTRFLGILEESEIPILIGDDISYVALEEIAEQHNIETGGYFPIWLSGWVNHAIFIGIALKLLFW